MLMTNLCSHNNLRLCLFFVFSRSPDQTPVKLKMLYASSKDALKKTLTGVMVHHQANDRSDLEYKAIEELAKK